MNPTFAVPAHTPPKTHLPPSSKHVPDKNQSVPSSELCETATGFDLLVELPGVRRENLAITVENGLLRLSAKRDPSPEGTVLIRETPSCDFAREFHLGSNIDTLAITALLERGILKLHLPKLPQSQPRHIPLLPSETN